MSKLVIEKQIQMINKLYEKMLNFTSKDTNQNVKLPFFKL